jgi:hypothetical protein
MPEASSDTGTAYALLLLFVAVAILIGAAILARKNIRDGRGDRRGAARLAFYVGSGLMIIWLCQVHVSGSVETVATFLVAVCTSVFYGVLLWTVYLALEPFVRRHWPHVLVSWTSVLTGRASDPVVGRDVLIGVALGVWFALLFRTLAIVNKDGVIAFPGEVDVLLGLRSTLGVVLQEGFYSIRNVLLYFFVLFAMRMALRRQWAAVIGFIAFFVVIGALGDERMWLGALQGLLFAGSAALVIVRFGGLLAFVVGSFVSALLFDVLITLDTSAWYFGSNMLLVAIVVGLTLWGFYTASRVRGLGSSARTSRA